MQPIQINDSSILSELKKYKDKPELVLSEFIWNSFDANAKNVHIEYSFKGDVGYPMLSISDDGDGWNMGSKSTSVTTFLDSEKRNLKSPYKSLPHGSRGMGRFSFYTIADSVEWESNCNGKKYTLILRSSSISKYDLHEESIETSQLCGSKVSFNVNSTLLTPDFFENRLKKDLLRRFAWFLVLYPEKHIYINDELLKYDEMIEKTSDEHILLGDCNIPVKLIQWKSALVDKEHSNVYFIDNDGNEIFKVGSGLNNKSDVFFHAAYVKSDLFKNYTPSGDEREVGDLRQLTLDHSDRRMVNTAKKEIRRLLEEFRKPYIEKISHGFVNKLKEERVMPPSSILRIPEQDFSELIRQTYVIAPEMYIGASPNNKKMILSLMASLMGTPESNLILKTIEGIYDLSDRQRLLMEELLDRTSLGGIIDTVGEIKHRLQTLSDLETLVYDSEKYRDTLEVKHLQRILDNEFWVFGEEYRLVSSTEGAIKKTIEKFASTVLSIENYDSVSESRKEVDLFLSKSIVTPRSGRPSEVHNIIVELKRPSVKLGKEQLNQLQEYRNKILEDPLCKSPNMRWTFILVGRDFADDDVINDAIETNRANGEFGRGLVEHLPKKNSKMYVRRWSDIIECELRPQYSYLQQKLNMNFEDYNLDASHEEIVARHG